MTDALSTAERRLFDTHGPQNKPPTPDNAQRSQLPTDVAEIAGNLLTETSPGHHIGRAIIRHGIRTLLLRARQACVSARPSLLSWNAMKEGLPGGTLSVSPESELEEARLHVARWIGSQPSAAGLLSAR